MTTDTAQTPDIDELRQEIDRLDATILEAVQELVSFGDRGRERHIEFQPTAGQGHTAASREKHFLRRRDGWWHTHMVLNLQGRFFNGYPPAVSVV